MSFTDNLKNNLVNKDHESFWQSWKAKFKSKGIKNVVIDGLNCNTDIANRFAQYFKANSCCNDINISNKRFSEFLLLHDEYVSSNPTVISTELISVELINKCLDSMQIGKAPGNDNIEVEHLLFAHALLLILLC